LNLEGHGFVEGNASPSSPEFRRIAARKAAESGACGGQRINS
jgi:hypothetical protein